MIITGGAIAQPSPSSTTDYDPTASLSLTIPFGAGGIRDFGISLNLLTTNEENAWMGGAGVTFYPARDNKLGCSVIGGRNFTNSELHFGYDFCQKVFNFGVGVLDTKGEDSVEVLQDSDIRLKQDVEQIATLDNGLKLYSFKYLWDDTTYVGVMAQDLLQQAGYRDTVTTGNNGFYAVYYSRLGLKMVTLDEWQQDNTSIFL
ncbi:tail fiber domain-containing protein [Solemya velum gill symbiont]|uniref:Peptidase S74 domain-containing protein n=1 Tax=Solemya velum gill symbiont TaxID=2340 RepID=A0A1T2J727_SOVGS|nr:tail fiber domain-containing protein [Solemya velum gill symbiont]OOY33880.1 hypothetical protein BOV88_12920 [Solemya velum gill symbiont]OOY36535.1 hypothetical protein BOV89_12055 [Solemya velum gill symbiont]OOY39342.1 hypothetical protein BOV90_09810 [Solemya velum gill symbiont]OOY45728.1 hypothetical protein BOV93_12375 [Solemya velum gill symbiont]OOY49277.1 hypothetical protein BOV94_11595 [Solemya velum gill symbiont]